MPRCHTASWWWSNVTSDHSPDTPERIAQFISPHRSPNVALNYQVLDFLPAARGGASSRGRQATGCLRPVISI